jgi:hypothetical protein
MASPNSLAQHAASTVDRLIRHAYAEGQLDMLNRLSRLEELAKADGVSADNFRRCILQAFREESERLKKERPA